MTGLPGLNFPAFAAMTANLRADGHTVTNPAQLNPDGGSWTDCMRRDIAALMYCDTVATLPGWAPSSAPRPQLPLAERLLRTVGNAHDLVSMEAV
ncbi:hypothetical protein PS910_04403 [Pseudomonas fluorescens]|nr:hypothetical protein PS910_04403 [Pseudomonas fluorescens]